MKTEKLVQGWLRTVTVICLLTGAVLLETVSLQVVGVAYQLTQIELAEIKYNVTPLKDDTMLEKHWQNEKEIQSYYNSSYTIVRTYSHLPFVVKCIVFFLAVLLVISVPYAVIGMFMWRNCLKEKCRVQVAKSKREARLAKKAEERAKELLEILIWDE